MASTAQINLELMRPLAEEKSALVAPSSRKGVLRD